MLCVIQGVEPPEGQHLGGSTGGPRGRACREKDLREEGGVKYEAYVSVSHLWCRMAGNAGR
jgi:hypothetical protein